MNEKNAFQSTANENCLCILYIGETITGSNRCIESKRESERKRRHKCYKFDITFFSLDIFIFNIKIFFGGGDFSFWK